MRVSATLGTAKKVFFGLAVSSAAAALTACGEASDSEGGAPELAKGGAAGSAGAGGSSPASAPHIDVTQGVAGAGTQPVQVVDPGGGVPIYRAPPLPLNTPTPKTPTSPASPANRGSKG